MGIIRQRFRIISSASIFVGFTLEVYLVLFFAPVEYARVAHLMEHKSNVRVVEMSACLVWLRDLGPSVRFLLSVLWRKSLYSLEMALLTHYLFYHQFVVREGDTRSRREIAGVDWQYNAYGGTTSISTVCDIKKYVPTSNLCCCQGYNDLFGPEDHQLNTRKGTSCHCFELPYFFFLSLYLHSS